MRVLHLSILFAASSLDGCTTASVRSSDGMPLTGIWGGIHAGLTLTPAGGTIAYDCAHGGIRAPVVPDGAGSFLVDGVHFREHGGPVRIGEVPDSLPAHYLGQVTGDHMTLRVLVAADTLGPFELQRGENPRLFRCL